ncbi:MAG: hypothetical protein K2X56_25145 [Mycobacterium pseudokansasii]|uniref:hypothetical protein n=1 Tax=Mycobacterium pseudokansasii TaxID=2341080 RepID=UPI000AD2E8B4|nr:hypothetical protein [Mycobacterium pseudokansasii]MBY0391286.1 hypothetical protein [Mycobacterium pseudokansasii]VAZ97180.1 hypothetical protein LAUMK35_03589 [Mycobacterium pseudokansasii]VAZ98591.1 hypothetical protein LAUMK21_03586 [Mycobacterium pseudokansasii]
MLIGWRAVARRHAGVVTSLNARRVAQLCGCIAVLLMAILGCTSVTEGTATPDTKVAPAYRSSVSVSLSASSATSSIRESQRQQSLTTKAIRSSCETLATTSKDAIDKVNAFVSAFNAGRSTGPAEGPAIEALNNSASSVTGSLSDALSREMRDALNAYADAALAVANAIGTHAPTGEFNRRVDQLNDTKTKALKMCMASY